MLKPVRFIAMVQVAIQFEADPSDNYQVYAKEMVEKLQANAKQIPGIYGTNMLNIREVAPLVHDLEKGE